MIRVDRCEHEPMLYGETKDSQYGERTLFFCECRECNIGTFGYLNPVEAVRDWYSNKGCIKPAFVHYPANTKKIYG